MSKSSRTMRTVPWLLLLLAALLGVFAWIAVDYLRTQYDWRDGPILLGRAAEQLSRRRLAVAVVLSIGTVWAIVRRRSSLHDTYAALMAYLGGLLADAVVLLSLEPLGISYGPVLLPLAVLAAVRCGVALGLGGVAWLAGLSGRRRALWPLLHGLGQALVLLIVVDAFVLEPSGLTTSHLTVQDPHSTTPRPLRIVQISDLHLERANALSWRIVRQTNALQPDVIVLTGDYLNISFPHDQETRRDLRTIIGSLQAPYGIYAVSGNVDPENLDDLFGGLPVNALDDRWVLLEIEGHRIALAGLALHRSLAEGRDRKADRQALTELARGIPADRLSILLHHTPDMIPEAAASGFDLYLCGHTHGGQVRLPFYGALTTFSLYGKRYEMGTYREGNTLIYVSRGVGLEGWIIPRVRLLCPPEIVNIEIR